MVERHLSGETLANIAQQMQLNYYTVRKWWRKYQQEGWAGLEPKPPGPAPAGPLSQYDPLVKVVEHHQTPLANYDRIFHLVSGRFPYFHAFSLFIPSVSCKSIAFLPSSSPVSFLNPRLGNG